MNGRKPWLKHYDEGVPPTIDYPRIPLYRLLDEAAAQHRDRPCTNFFGKQLSYHQVKELSDRFAHGLRRLGVKKGDRVALLLPNSPAFVIAYFGTLKAGGVVVPLNPLYSSRELAFHLSDSAAKAAVTIPIFLEKVAALRGEAPLKRIVCTRLADFLPFPLGLLQSLRERKLLRQVRLGEDLVDLKELLREPPTGFRPEPVDVNELAVLIYSGGTTGVAKGIMLSHFNIVANAHQVARWGHLSAGDRMLAVLPLFHGFGMSVCMNAPILAGVEILLVPRFNARDLAKVIHKYRPTVAAAVPTILVALANLPEIDRYDFSSLNAVWVGAAPLTAAIKSEFEEKTGGRAIEGYGLTEAVTAIMANPYKGLHKAGSIGIPFPDVEAKIVDLDDGHDLPPGEQGEIVLRGPTVMLGYYKRPKETAEALKGGWLYTGDIGYMDEEGYFYITDRKKDLIITGGFNVFPREIDELIYRHPKVKEGITVGVSDEYKGERIKVFIVLKEGETATPEEFIAYFRENLVPYKVPSEVEFREEFPKSPIGKILRRQLREEESRKMKEAPTSQGEDGG